MILPIISSISREVFRQVPREQVEAALALGATRWEMIRTAVLPFGQAGVMSASILGLGRALGETIAVTIVLSNVYAISWHLTQTGGITIASNIALKYGEAGDIGTGALIASGLCLFVITLAVNFSAPADHHPPAGRGPEMAVTTEPRDRRHRPRSALAARSQAARRTRCRRSPSSSCCVTLLLWATTGFAGRAGFVVVRGCCCSSPLQTAVSFGVEGRRQAVDRLFTTLVDDRVPARRAAAGADRLVHGQARASARSPAPS